MTYARKPNTFANAWTVAMAVVGIDRLARACLVTPWRLQQLANPMKGDAALERAAVADRLCAEAGQGTPFLDTLEQRINGANLRRQRSRTGACDRSAGTPGGTVSARLRFLLKTALAVLDAAEPERAAA